MSVPKTTIAGREIATSPRGYAARKLCQECLRKGTAYQCDGVNLAHKSGTCDRSLCAGCAKSIDDKHLCPRCYAVIPLWGMP